MSETSRHRVRRSRDEWRQLIDEQAHSGLSQAAFCASRSLSLSSFQNWKRRLAEPSAQDDWLDLGRMAGQASSGWDIELELGNGVCLRLRRC